MGGDELLEMVEFADDYSADFGIGSGNEWEFVGFETEELDEDVALKLGCGLEVEGGYPAFEFEEVYFVSAGAEILSEFY